MELLRSFCLFMLAGLSEIGGGYLIWQWLRAGKSPWVALAGAVMLVIYGVVPTFQAAHFGRVYAAYGGAFIVLSLFWSWQIDGIAPDRFDLLGASIILIGVCVMMYWPRA
jgi:small multidrug resistance family-3 protein